MDDVSLLIRRNKRASEIKLVLSNRQIQIVPNSIYQLTHLQILDLSYNKISQLDQNLTNLLNLKFLDVSYNNIQQLDKCLHILGSRLDIFKLNSNPLNEKFLDLLEQEFQKQPKLKETFDLIFIKDEPLWFDNPKISQTMPNFKKEIIKEIPKEQFIQKEIQNINQQNNQNVQQNNLEIAYEELHVIKTISQGGFSLVYKGIYRGTDVAIKKIFDPNVTQDLLDEFENEIQMLSNLRHPNIVLIMGVVSKPPNLSIVTEYLPNGSLFYLLHQSKIEITQEQKIKIAVQIAKSIQFLHESKIAHRDIKSHNILLDDNFKTKLCDFGLAKYFVIFQLKSDLNKGQKQFCGTPCYMAPELFQKRSYSYKIDIFAFGTLLHEILTREVPYEGLDPQDIMKKVVANNELQGSGKFSYIIEQCRKVDPQQRQDINWVIQKLEETF